VISGSIHDASWLVTDRTVGASQGAFAFGNLAVHVGDDPAAVAANRSALADQLGVPAVVFTRAAHSSRVEVVERVVSDIADCDALITDRPDLAIAAQGADCAMIGIATTDGWIAAIHCGWKGLVGGVVPATLQALAAAGSDLAGARAHVGPTICAACYPVDEERAQQVAGFAPDAVVSAPGGPAVDVQAGVVVQLREYAIGTTSDPRCTAETPELYSYRRDGVTGRQALAIVRRAA
jgi:purine-nucleoside/S-methyl-5'-thioadenosine phosphorylase / adenosine deaminase